MKYFGFLNTINETTLIALKRRQFYDTKKIKPDKETTSINVTFFKDVLPQIQMKRNSIILRTEQEVVSQSATNAHDLYTKLEKHAIQFQFDVNHPLMLFLCLIPLAMIDQIPERLFDIRDKEWSKYTASLPANTWVDPQHLPYFVPIFQDFDSNLNPIFEAVVNKHHYMQALFAAQVKEKLKNELILF